MKVTLKKKVQKNEDVALKKKVLKNTEVLVKKKVKKNTEVASKKKLLKIQKWPNIRSLLYTQKKFRTHVIKLDIAPKSLPPGQYLLVSASNNMLYYLSQ